MKALVRFSADKKYDFKILKAVESVNDRQKRVLVKQDGGALRVAEGQDDRHLGPGVQAEDRRHARGAGDADHQALLEKGAKVQAYDPEAMKVRDGIFGSKVDLRDQELRRAARAPMRWRSSPSGTSSASPTSRGCAS